MKKFLALILSITLLTMFIMIPAAIFAETGPSAPAVTEKPAVASIGPAVVAENTNPASKTGIAVTRTDTAVRGTLSTTDPDGDALTYAQKPESGPAHGIVNIDAGGAWQYEPQSGFHGIDRFVAVADDGKGGTADLPMIVLVLENVSPIATNLYLITQVGKPVASAVLALDPEGDFPLAFTLVPESAPAHGSVALKPNGMFTYTPNPGFQGDDTFRIRISDSLGAEAVVTVRVRVNAPPTAKPVHVVTQIGKPVDGIVMATDPTADPLAYILKPTARPAHGSAVVKVSGAFTYTPAEGYHGADRFVVKVYDLFGGEVDIDVTVTVNAPPTGQAVFVETLINLTVSGSLTATDPDGDSLTFALKSGSGPMHGAVDVLASGAWTYAPSTSQAGDDSFVVTVSDGKGGSGDIAVNIRVRACMITGFVKTRGGKALADAALTVLDANGHELAHVATDADGRFQIDGLPAAMPLRIQAAVAGYLPATQIVTIGNEAVAQVEFSLDAIQVPVTGEAPAGAGRLPMGAALVLMAAILAAWINRQLRREIRRP